MQFSQLIFQFFFNFFYSTETDSIVNFRDMFILVTSFIVSMFWEVSRAQYSEDGKVIQKTFVLLTYFTNCLNVWCLDLGICEQSENLPLFQPLQRGDRL